MSDGKADELTAEIQAAGGEAIFAKVNVADGAAVAEAAAAVIARWGRIDVLVNNAGIVRDAQLVKVKDGAVASVMTDEAWDAVINVNLKGVFLCTRAVVPHMIKGGGGVVLTASSVVGLYGNFGQTNYAATKGGLITMTKTWARELGKLQDPGQRGGARVHRHRDPHRHAGESHRHDGGPHPAGPHGRSRRTSPTRTSGSPPTRRRSCTAR